MNALVIKNLEYQYPDGRYGLRGVDFTIGDGNRVALIGSNGSGKTTLLLHVIGLLDGDGYIEVMGIKRTKKTIKEIRKRVGFLFSQVEYQFIMPDLLNDIMLSFSETSLTRELKKENALQWLENLNLTQYSDRSPLDLSSGEMKRAALAAILSRDPDILLLDEPLNNLDKHNSMILIEILKSLKNTMIFATHRRLLAEQLSTHIAIMEGGRITGFYKKEDGLKLGSEKDLLF
jgi:cobalt/nickel transport system ATP-binding protein